MTLKEIVPDKVTEFTASNGVHIDTYRDVVEQTYMVGRLGENPITGTGYTHVTASAEGIDALREFFRHEEDERLSRWRSKIDPDIVGYAIDDASIRLVDESTRGNTSIFYRTDTDGLGPLSKAAQEYFDAHPEPKPAWHDAKPGEVWALRVDHAGVKKQYGEEVACTVERGDFVAVAGLMRIDYQDSQITAARRIWPEDAS